MVKVTEVEGISQATALLQHLNACHDGSLRNIHFRKQRDVMEDGSLSYGFQTVADFVLCNVEAELLLNSYEGAKPDQIVLLEFKEVSEIMFARQLSTITPISTRSQQLQKRMGSFG